MVEVGTSSRKNGSIRTIIADDHNLARENLQDILAEVPDIDIVGEAANGREALLLCSRLKPDLVLMDVRMPEMDGLTATHKVKQRHPETAVLMVTMHENPDMLLDALNAGAAGYVLKDADQAEIVSAVRRVREGESPLDQELAARLLRRLASEYSERRTSLHSSNPHAALLTPRQLEVLRLMKLGRTNPEIGRELRISTRTAKNHVENVMNRLSVSDRTQAVVKALQLGLVELT